MKNRKRSSTLTLGVVLVTASTALAEDNKAFHGSAFRCVDATCTNVAIGPSGISNTGAVGNRQIFQTLLKDLNGNFELSVFFNSRLNSACYVHVVDFTSGSGIMYTMEQAPGSPNELTRLAGAFPAGYLNPPFILCNLTPGARLTGTDYSEL